MNRGFSLREHSQAGSGVCFGNVLGQAEGWLCGESQEISSFRTAASIVCQPDARLQLQPALWVLYWDLRHRSWPLLWDLDVLVAVLDVCSVPIFPF